MWGLFHREEHEPSDASSTVDSSTERKSVTPRGKERKRLGFGRRHLHSKRTSDDDIALNIAVNDEAMNVDEAHCGIEVSLDWKASHKSEQMDESNHSEAQSRSFVSLSHQLKHCRKVHKSQFSTNFPALEQISCFPGDDSQKTYRRNHRVPILDVAPGYVQSPEEMLALLESFEPQDEVSAVRQELNNLNAELEAIEDDRYELDKSFVELPPTTPEKKAASEESDEDVPKWDVHYLLGGRNDLTPLERAQLQQNRGLCLTLNMQNPRAREAFSSKCGSKVGIAKGKFASETYGASLSLGPHNCKSGGAGATIRYFSIMNGGDSGSSFFVSRDSGKSFSWGPFPPRLHRRMKKAGIVPQNGEGGLTYLTTGPRGCYFCQFDSGECWWGNALGDDHDFDSIVTAWDVFRVAFGPMKTFADKNGETILTNSWIILSRDGRVAWKNLPLRLHNRLYDRLADWAAPVAVSLGFADSYFIRFLDGSVDYCLPAAAASACEDIERRGGIITDMVLHPEVAQEYIIRHTELST